MSGILERIEAKLDQLLSGTANTLAQSQPTQQPQVAAQTLAQPQVAQTGLGGVAGLGGAPAGAGAGYPPATQEMIVALVTPMVNDPATKAALQAEMQAMGIAALPDAQPHQYPELYWRFQQVQQRIAAQQAQQPQAAAVPASII